MFYGDNNLEQQINMLFNKHDYNRSGFLGVGELCGFLNDLFAAMGQPFRINDQYQAQQLLMQIDRNCDGKASRKEVRLMYQHVLSHGAQYGGQGGFNQGGFNQGGFNQGGFNQGGFNQGGFNQGGFNQGGFGQQGVVNLGGGGFNTGIQGGFQYSGTGWNGGHDQYLQSQIDRVYMTYDRNYTGQLQQAQFFNAYRDLCLGMNQTPPNDYYTIQQIAMKSDTNFDGRVSKMEMFNLFKRAQFNLY